MRAILKSLSFDELLDLRDYANAVLHERLRVERFELQRKIDLITPFQVVNGCGTVTRSGASRMKKKRRIKVRKRDKKKTPVVRAFTPDALLKRSIRGHFTRLGSTKSNDGSLILPGTGKEIIRKLHNGQREERLEAGAEFIRRALPKALPQFANGQEIDPSKIQLRLVRVQSDTADADLFRIASLTWSVPVSTGFGRRLRYLVWDEHHERVVGLIALGDPVFNLSVRDNLIGWNVHDRAERLVGLLDAYVLGAVPPYEYCFCAARPLRA